MIHSLPDLSRARLLSLLAALLGALAIAGCGGDEEEPAADEPAVDEEASQEYVEEVRQAIGPVASQSQDLINQALQARSVDDLVMPLGNAEDAYRDAVDDLDGITPPAESEDLHTDLIAAHESIAQGASDAVQAAKNGEPQGLQEFQRAGEEYREETERITQEFAERGIEF